MLRAFFSVSCHCNHNNNSTKSFHVESQRCVRSGNQQRFFSFSLPLFLQKSSLTKSEILLSCYGINAIRQGIPLGRCIMDCNISNCCPPQSTLSCIAIQSFSPPPPPPFPFSPFPKQEEKEEGNPLERGKF